jgi:hypothetical protein
MPQTSQATFVERESFEMGRGHGCRQLIGGRRGIEPSADSLQFRADIPVVKVV